jgi:hypothetical protein
MRVDTPLGKTFAWKDKGKRKSMRAKDFTHIARGSSGVKSAREMGKSHS